MYSCLENNQDGLDDSVGKVSWKQYMRALNARLKVSPRPFFLVYCIDVRPYLSPKSSLLKMAQMLGLLKQKWKREIELWKNKQTRQICWPAGFAQLMCLNSLAAEVKRQWDEGCSFSTCPRRRCSISKEENIFSSRRFTDKSEWASLSRQSGVEKDGRQEEGVRQIRGHLELSPRILPLVIHSFIYSIHSLSLLSSLSSSSPSSPLSPSLPLSSSLYVCIRACIYI